MGQDMDIVGLFVIMQVEVVGMFYDVDVISGGVIVLVGFLGLVFMIGGVIEFSFDVGIGLILILQSVVVIVVGFGIFGLWVCVDGDILILLVIDGFVVDIDIQVFVLVE